MSCHLIRCATLEPNLRQPIHRGLHFKGARHVTDPQELVHRMQTRFETLGGRYCDHSVEQVQPDDQGGHSLS